MNVVATVRAIVLVYGAVLFGFFALTRLAGRLALRKRPSKAAAKLRSLELSMSFCAGIAIVFVGIPTGLLAVLDVLTQRIPVVGSRPIQNALFSTSVVFGPVLAGHVVVTLATLPLWRELKDIDVSARSAVRNATVRYAAFVGPKLGLFLLAGAFEPGLTLVAVTAAAYVVYEAVAPVLVERLNDTRALDPDERDVLGEIADREIPVRVIDASDAKEAQGYAAGVVPGRRCVYLTDFLLDELPDAEIRAVAEHEFAHLRRGHLPLRKGLYCLLVVGVALVIADLSVEGLLLLALFGIPLWLVIAAVVRWTEYDADRAAAEAASPDAMAWALDILAERNLIPREYGRVGGLLSKHPSTERRTTKLAE